MVGADTGIPVIVLNLHEQGRLHWVGDIYVKTWRRWEVNEHLLFEWVFRRVSRPK